MVLTVASIVKFFLGKGDELALKGLSSELRKRVRKLRQEGDIVGAAELLFQSEQYEAAAALFAEAKMSARAAEAQELAGNAAQAIALYKRAGNRAHAGELYAEMGQYEAAALEMLASGLKERAAEYFSKGGQHRRAAELFVEMNKWLRAAKCYQDAGDTALQMDMFIKAFDDEYEIARGNLKLIEAARAMAKQAADYYMSDGNDLRRGLAVLMKAGFKVETADALAKAGRLAQAAELYEECGLFDKAAEAYTGLNKPQMAARVRARAAMAGGDLEQAAQLLTTGGDLDRAAEILLDMRQVAKAAAMFTRAGNHVRAGELFEKLNDLPAAAKAFESGSDNARAADLYSRLGDAQGEMRACEAMEDHYRVGRILVTLNRLEEAIESLSRVEASDPWHNEALELKGDILWKSRKHDSAFSAYRNAFGDANPNASNIQLLYKMGRCMENEGNADAARQAFEQVVGVDANYRDVGDRLGKVRSEAGRVGPADRGQQASAVLKRPARVSSHKLPAVQLQPPEQPLTAGATNPFELAQTTKSVDRRYEVIEEIARGGMGVVYRARDLVLSRIIAYKVLSKQLRDNEHAREYFLREARAAAKLSHSNIVTVFDAGIQDGEYYMAMEYIDGKTLKQIVQRQGPFPEKLVRYILTYSCKGLQFAHDRGIVHRDIKSGNIMLANEDKALKIMDFGLAKVVTEAQHDHTRAIGTPFYMSPEQILGNELDQRSDIYSLGVMLFEVATGTVPFFKGDLAYHHVHSPPPSPRSLNPKISKALETIILKAMQKKPEERFTNCNDILTELKNASPM